ncbi:MAG: sulfite exporter TauE/SafE family protein [Paracoccaceae bacterium]
MDIYAPLAALDLSPSVALMCLAVGLFAGVVKGLVGFAMPMMMISGLGALVSPELALAGLIVPTLVTNGWQALRQGPRAAAQSIRKFWRFLAAGGVMLLLSAQLVRVLPVPVMLAAIGVPITIFAISQMMGRQLRLAAPPSARIEAGIGAFAGFIGGFSGVWGPPTVALLTAMDTPKQEQMRVQGVIYGLGAVALLGAHVTSGVLSRATLPFSVMLVVPALIGMGIGLRLQDRIDQAQFRRATMVVLLLAGLNLIRRALIA